MKRGDIVKVKDILDYKGIVIDKAEAQGGKYLFKVLWFKGPFDDSACSINQFHGDGLILDE
tara:strand:- start:361 stop:543 length:183 start_codon:yes stop_codon:yes gene_type:complete